MRKRHNSTKEREKLRELYYDEDNIITKFLLSEEYSNDIPEPTVKNKSAGFYSSYNINLPINCQEYSKELNK